VVWAYGVGWTECCTLDIYGTTQTDVWDSIVEWDIRFILKG